MDRTDTPDIRMRVLDLTQLIFWLNAALDTGKYADVTVEEVAEKVDDASIFPYLRDRLADSNVVRPHFEERVTAEITAAMQSLLDAHGGGHQWAVDNNGLHVLVAWAAEMIQDGARETTLRLPWSRRR